METTSQQISGNVTVKVKDALGREIEVKKLKTLDRMRLFEIIGSDNASNRPYLGHAMLAYSVVAIDGQSIPRPSSKLALEGMVKLLEDEGFEAVGTAVSENFLGGPKNDEETRTAIKNEQSTQSL